MHHTIASNQDLKVVQHISRKGDFFRVTTSTVKQDDGSSVLFAQSINVDIETVESVVQSHIQRHCKASDLTPVSYLDPFGRLFNWVAGGWVFQEVVQ